MDVSCSLLGTNLVFSIAHEPGGLSRSQSGRASHAGPRREGPRVDHVAWPESDRVLRRDPYANRAQAQYPVSE
jgi:hypothetical protein